MELGLEGSICKEKSIHSTEVLLVDVHPCLWIPHRYVKLGRILSGGTGLPGGTGDSRGAPLLT